MAWNITNLPENHPVHGIRVIENHAHANTYTHMNVSLHTYIHTHTHTHIHTHTHTYTDKYIHLIIFQAFLRHGNK